MLLRLRYCEPFSIVIVNILLLFTFSCIQVDRYSGKYLATEKEQSEQTELFIELQEDGIGIWRALDDEVSFRWDVKNNQIRLHTKSGGVILGEIQGDHTFEIELPGHRVLNFKKVK